jgi:uncharacterized integral membrane protein
MGNYVRAIFFIVVVLFLIIFGIKNSQTVDLNYFGMKAIALPLYAVIFISILIGILGGMLVGFGGRMELKRRIRTLEKEGRVLEKKVTQGKESDRPMEHVPGDKEEEG